MPGDHVPEPVACSQQLRARLEVNLGRHDRWELPLDGRRHGAVAGVILDSDPVLHGDYTPTEEKRADLLDWRRPFTSST
ncbi:MAG TPA: hypothetical protein VFN68_15750 [Acidimicrobiales bacterium]|nr:hypothetical protein [Acidimicrobiales bacterium]